MTWTGYFYNLTHSEPSLDRGKSTKNVENVKSKEVRPNEPPASSVKMPSDITLTQNREVLFAQSAAAPTNMSTPNNKKKQEQDEALDAVSRNLAELHSISLTLGESLDMQNGKLDTISTKTERVDDATLEVLVKSSQLIDRNSNETPILVGEYCFEIHTGGYLEVQDERLVIGAPIPNLSTTFRCYRKGDNIFGMVSCRTLKYIATGYFTPVSVSGLKFNSAAQIFLDLSGEYNGLLMLTCNWGSGGWLRFSGTTSSDFKLTSSLRDKDNRVLLRAIPIKINEKAHKVG